MSDRITTNYQELSPTPTPKQERPKFVSGILVAHLSSGECKSFDLSRDETIEVLRQIDRTRMQWNVDKDRDLAIHFMKRAHVPLGEIKQVFGLSDVSVARAHQRVLTGYWGNTIQVSREVKRGC